MRNVLWAWTALVVAACSAGTGNHQPSGTLIQIEPAALRQEVVGGSITLSHEGVPYQLLEAPSISREGFLRAGAKSVGAVFEKPKPGSAVAAECVLGVQDSWSRDFTSLGGDHLAGYRSFQCFAPANSTGWTLYLPTGSDAQISSVLKALGGEAGERGIFGRRGTFIVLGYVVDQKGVVTSFANAAGVAIQVEYWLPTGEANDPQGVVDDFTAAGSWAASTAAKLRGLGVRG